MKIKLKSFLNVFTLGALFFLTACGGGGSDTPTNLNGIGESDDQQGNESLDTRLPAPNNVYVERLNDNLVKVSWGDVEGANTYTVHYAKQTAIKIKAKNLNTLAGYKKVEQLTGNTVNVPLPNSKNRYYFLVTANNKNGQGRMSDQFAIGNTKLTLNDTSITLCGNYPTDPNSQGYSNKLDCNVGVDSKFGTVPKGQDGHYATGYSNLKIKKFSHVKNHVGQCVRDEHTGLIWEVKQGQKGLHFKGNVYDWYDPYTNSDDRDVVYGSGSNTHAFIEAVNAEGWCGYKDWRLPTLEELRSIVDYGRMEPSISSDYFPNTQEKGIYFTYDYGHTISFYDGRDGGKCSVSCAVRLVRND